MLTTEIKLEIDSRTEPVKIVFAGDFHVGNAHVDEDLIKDFVRGLQVENTYWIDLGDDLDLINLKDPRFDPRELPDWVTRGDLADLAAAQMHRFKELFEPVRKNCLIRIHGNHEEMIRLHTERDVYGRLNEWFGMADDRVLGYSGFVRLRIVRAGRTWTLILYLTHGAGGGKLAGSKALNLERLPMSYDADVYAMGHTHTKMGLIKRRIGMRSRKKGVQDKHIALINVGSFMRGEEGGYAERRMLYPQGLGPVELWLWPDPKEGEERVMRLYM